MLKACRAARQGSTYLKGGHDKPLNNLLVMKSAARCTFMTICTSALISRAPMQMLSAVDCAGGGGASSSSFSRGGRVSQEDVEEAVWLLEEEARHA